MRAVLLVEARDDEHQVVGAMAEELRIRRRAGLLERGGAGAADGGHVAALGGDLLAQEFEFVHAVDFTTAGVRDRRVASHSPRATTASATRCRPVGPSGDRVIDMASPLP
jgi:hypothetical protein